MSIVTFWSNGMEQTGKTYHINGETIKARKKTNNKWFETQDSISYWDDFSKQKIMYNDISQRLSFCLVPENIFCVNTVYFMKDNPHLKYLLAFLNTNIVDWYYRTLSVQLGEKAVRMFSIYVENIPVTKISKEAESQVCKLIDSLEDASESEIIITGNKIESLIADNIGLSSEERNYIYEIQSRIHNQ